MESGGKITITFPRGRRKMPCFLVTAPALADRGDAGYDIHALH